MSAPHVEYDETRERERFEKWAMLEGMDTGRRAALYGPPGTKGRYRDSDTYYAWEGWQARATTGAKP